MKNIKEYLSQKKEFLHQVKEARTYVKSPGEAPKGASLKRGARDGMYYEDDAEKQTPKQEPAKQKPAGGKIETKPVELFPGEETELTDLELTIETEAKLQPQHDAIVKNMLKKIKAGTYSPELAVKGWRYWVDAGAKIYEKDFQGLKFSTKVKNELAKRKALEMKKMIDDGEFDHLK